jgi:hypothetical protein
MGSSAPALVAGSPYGHAVFALLFFFGHIWHGSRTLFRDVFAGIDPDLSPEQVEWGFFAKVGDTSTRQEERFSLNQHILRFL